MPLEPWPGDFRSIATDLSWNGVIDMLRVQRLCASAPQGIIFTNRRDEITHWNGMAENIFGWSSREAIGRNLGEIIRNQAPDLADRWGCDTPNDLSLQAKLVSASGETHLVEFLITPEAVDAQGDSYRIVFANDISHQWLREEQLQRVVGMQAVMNTILHVAMLDQPFQEQLLLILELVFAIPTLKILPQGAILVAEKNQRRLRLVAQKGLTAGHVEACAVVPLGRCGCGQAAEEEVVSYEGNCGDSPGFAEGPCRKLYPGAVHYSLPVRSANRVLGVLVLFLERPMSGPHPAMETMLAVTNVLAAVLGKDEMRRDQDELICHLRSSNIQLRAEKRFSESIIASLINGLLILDNEELVVACNPEGRRLLGQFFPGEMVGRRVTDIFGSELAEVLLDHHAELKPSAGTRQVVQLTTASGEVRLIEYLNFPRLDAAGGQEGGIISFSDITEADRLLRKMEKLDRFSTIAEIASAVAHEIRNPLAGIKAISQVVESQLTPADKNHEHLGRIINQVDRLNILLNDFFTYARPPKPLKKLSSLKDILGKVVPLLQSRADNSAIVLAPQIPADLSPVVVDPNQIQQVFLNILLNGLDAVKSQGEIEITAEEIGVERTIYNEGRFPRLAAGVPYVVVRIRDSGEGMEKAVREKIFEPFFTTKTTGTGLGLAIVKRIMKEHKAALFVESARWRGTTFFLFFRKH